MTDSVVDRLLGAGAALGIPVSVPQAVQLTAFLRLLEKWNRTYNLTSVRDPEQMLNQHLLDCLAIVGPLRRECGATDVQVLDVGSGGGLPGAVIALMQPSWSVSCVDAVGKKVAFVRQVASELSLPNLTGVHSRVEQIRGKVFDLVTSRAFSSLANFVQLTDDLVAPAGKWVAMKGKVPLDEVALLPCSVEMFHVEQLRIPYLDAERCLVWMRKRV